MIAPLAGALAPWSSRPPPAPAWALQNMRGTAAAPTALVLIGLFVAEPRANAAGRSPDYIALVVAEFLVQPALTWTLATLVFHLPAALPTGAGSFMLAEFHQREAARAPMAMLVSTALSIVTAAALLVTESPARG